jgi:hypothetical protein
VRGDRVRLRWQSAFASADSEVIASEGDQADERSAAWIGYEAPQAPLKSTRVAMRMTVIAIDLASGGEPGHQRHEPARLLAGPNDEADCGDLAAPPHVSSF